MLLIYCIMAIQLDSLRQPLIVLASVPLSFVGVTLGLLLTGTPFSFMVFIGAVPSADARQSWLIGSNVPR